jgi:hypothetical protein
MFASLGSCTFLLCMVLATRRSRRGEAMQNPERITCREDGAMATKHGVVIVVIAVLMGSGVPYAHNGLAASADISYSVLQVDPSVDPMAPVVPGSSSTLVRTHGQPIPGQVKEQISMYNGGSCHDLESDPPDFDPNDACADVQFTVFP